MASVLGSGAELVIRIVTDTQGAKGLDDTATGAQRLQSRLSGLVAPAAAVVTGVVAIGAASVGAASDVQQAFGAVDSVFGRSAGQVKKWAEGAATSVGLAKSEYAELAAVIGAQLKNMGVPLDQVAGKTDNLVRLGADLAATYGGTTREAVEALSSALRGETDPIERYGVSVKQADVAARMAADGTDKLTGAAAKQAKTAALLALVSEQTADAQGQFAREQDSAAGSAQVAAAQFQNAKAALGEALLPAVAAVATALAGMAGFVSENGTLFGILLGVLGAVAAAVLIVNGALAVYNASLVISSAATKVATAAQWLWNAALSANPVGLTVIAVLALVAAIVLLWKRSETFRSIVLGVWEAVRNGAVAVANVIRGVFTATWGAISSGVGNARDAVVGAWNYARDLVVGIAARIAERFDAAWDSIKAGVRGARDVAVGVWQGARDTIVGIGNAIRDLVSAAFRAIGSAVSGLHLTGPFDAVRGVIDGVIQRVQDLIGWLSRIKVPSIKLPDINPFGMLPGVAAADAGPSLLSAAPAVAMPVARAGGGGQVVNITVQGAVDPEGTARQLRRILAGHDRRVGLRT